jgi:hypothetical protein
MKWQRFTVAAVFAVAAISVPAMVGAGVNRTSEDVNQQGGGGVYAADAATLIRTSNGVNIQVTIPTPESSTYAYPDDATPGAPESFSGWAFVFNHPDLCTDPCNSDDIGADKPAMGGVYNIAGHVVGGATLTMSGHISVGQAPLRAAHAALELPATADVHVAIAPHGQLDPNQMPAQISTPIGNPAFWWVAFFE